MSGNTLSNTAVICLSPNQGGMEIDAVNTARSISKIANVIIIARHNSFIKNQFSDELDKIGIGIETIKFSVNLSLSIILNTRKLVDKYNIKNVIFFGASELKSLYFSFLGKDINLIIRHVTTKSSPKKDILHRIIYKNVSTYISISDHLKKNVYDILPVTKNARVMTLYPSLKQIPEEFSQKKRKSDLIKLLHVGSIIDGKGQMDAIKACEILYKMNKEFIFHIIGKMNPDYESRFNKFLETIPYRNSIKIVPFTLDIERYYRESDVFIFPSKGEGFGLAFAEALSFGLIGIAYNNTSFPEFKKLGFDFLISDNLSVESLKDSLQESLKYIEKNRVHLLQNINLSKKLFNEERLINQYREILK